MLDLLATPLVERRHADSLLVDEPKEQSDFAAAKKPCVETVAGRIHVHGQESAGRRGGGLQTRILSSLQPRALNYACMSAPSTEETRRRLSASRRARPQVWAHYGGGESG